MAIDGRNGLWSESQARQLLIHLKDLGFNYIQVGIHDTMASPTSNEILIDQCEEPWILTLSQNLALIDMAHELGLGVMMNPHLACTIDDAWNEPQNISPEDPTQWFESYMAYARYYAEIAEEHNVEILDLGGFMHRFYYLDALWGELLDDVHEIYQGEVAFSSFDYPIYYPDNPPFPHIDKLDILLNAFGWNGSGISLTGELHGHNHPTVSEMVGFFDFELSEYLDVLQERYAKPIMATDIYLWAVDGMNVSPVSFYWIDDWTRDYQELIDYTEAAFITMSSRNWRGVFFWSLSVGPPDLRGTEIRGTPFEDMIRVWFFPMTATE